MPRPPRIQFAGANDHSVTRGDARRKLFHDAGHYERFTRGLEDEVLRSGWIVLAYCWMPNHIHALLQTPEPNLGSGMQHWLSGYANWCAKRNRRTGHLYQGRYQAFLVEDGGSNCVNGSSAKARREEVSRCSVERLKRAVVGVHESDFERICLHEAVGEPSRGHAGRAQRSANLVQLFILTGAESVSHLVRRADRHHHQSARWRKTVQEVEASLGLNTEHKA